MKTYDEEKAKFLLLLFKRRLDSYLLLKRKIIGIDYG